MTSYLGRGLALALIGAAASCSLIVQRDGVQCSIDADCAKRGPAFAGSVCSPDRVCVMAQPMCKQNSDCATQPAVCNKNACVPLLTAECDHIIPAPAPATISNDAIVIGTIFSLKGTNASSGSARTNSAELALFEIARDVVGLPATTMQAKPRPLIALACTDTAMDGTDVSQKAAQHLVDAGIPAVIGPGSSGLVTTVAQNLTIPNGIFLITPSATATSLSGLSPLVWRTSPSDAFQAKALTPSIAEVEAAYRVANMLPMTTKTKLYIAYKSDAYGSGLFNLVSMTAMINGLSVNDAMNMGNFKALSFMPNATDLTPVVNDILAFKPHLIVMFGTTEVITLAMSPVEKMWPAMTPRPAYILSDGGHKPELLTLVTGNDPLRLRIRGTIPGTSSAIFGGFRNRYTSKFTGAFPDVFGMAGAYDSAYLVALTMTALAAAPITGGGMADQMKKMIGGTAFVFGQDKTLDAFNTLLANKNLAVHGASGPLNFDLAQHEAPSDIDVFCITNQMGTPFFTSSGRYYDATTQKMAGVFNCP